MRPKFPISQTDLPAEIFLFAAFSGIGSGKHKFAFVSKTGTAATSFTISAQTGGQQNTETGSTQTDNSKTGDNSLFGIVIAVAALILALGGVICVVILWGRKKIR